MNIRRNCMRMHCARQRAMQQSRQQVGEPARASETTASTPRGIQSLRPSTMMYCAAVAVFYMSIACSHANTVLPSQQHHNSQTDDENSSPTYLASYSSSSASLFPSSLLTSSALSVPSASSLIGGGGGGLVEPHLDGFDTTNVTAQIGTHAYLPCRVKQLGNKSVSWIRVRDGHILTVDSSVFIADQRFMALKQPDKFWTLQIKYVQARDAGAYECQVSSEPKVSARVHLQVVVPRTEILGDPDRYVKAGSTVILRCIVRGALEQPTFIIWSHGTEQLAADSRRHRTQVDRNPPENEGEAHSTIGSLIIESAKKRDTGNYTCSPSNSPKVTVMLNIINGESSASAVKSSAPNARDYTSFVLVSLFSVLLIGCSVANAIVTQRAT